MNLDQQREALRANGREFFFNFEALPGVNEETLTSAFASLDLTGNGYVGATELRHWLTLLGERPSDEEIDEMIRMVDI